MLFPQSRHFGQNPMIRLIYQPASFHDNGFVGIFQIAATSKTVQPANNLLIERLD
jgi:hypothetical protein